MQPLRGLAALTDFPPLPDLLEGIERTVTGVGRLELPAAEGATRLDAATAGLSRAARDIAEHGRPDPDAVEFRQFADLLLATPEETPIVAIESLFFEDGDGIIQEGAPPRSAAATSFGAAAVVSRGEHLCQAADEIIAASSMAQRHLRLHVLGGDLRTLSAGLPFGLEIAVEAFAAAAQAAVVRGTAVNLSAEYADLIREAGSRLRGFTEVTQPATLAAMFEDLTAAMDRLGTEPAPTPAAASRFEAAPVASPPSLTVGVDDDVVPIESLAPAEVTPGPDLPYLQVGERLPAEDEEPEAEVVPIEWLAPDGPAEAAVVEVASSGWDLAASYARFEALLVSGDGGTIAAPAPRPAVAPVAPELPLVEIEELLYHGRAALQRADELRRVIRSAISAEQPMSAIRPLVDELLDLVELAVAD
jgi:hypothetical protein